MKSLNKLLIKCFGSAKRFDLIFLSKQSQFTEIQLIIRIFYLLIFLFESNKFTAWSNWISKTNFAPLWPVYWLKYVDSEAGILAILWLGLISALLGITFPNWRFTRILVFLSLLEFIAFKNSFGKIGHNEHLSILISFILIFLPSGWHSLKKVNQYTKNATFLVFSGCQALIMLTYTMAGVGKIWGALEQALQGEIHALAPKALALHIAFAFSQQDSQVPLGIWLMEHYYIGWPLMIGTVYLQFFALWSVLRPSLHQIWGFSLLSFHIGSAFIMNVAFVQNTIWLALFFINSPFRPLNFKWQQILRDLPLFGYFFHWLKI